MNSFLGFVFILLIIFSFIFLPEKEAFDVFVILFISAMASSH